jgi:very-short-patch-repair endonuclease
MSRIFYKNYKDITLLARSLRRDSTPSEKLFWKVLRGRSMAGYKFLRQHPVFYRIDRNCVEFYIVDFYCSELKLIIELDGPIHEYHIEQDKERESKLKSRGFFILRIKNEELSEIDPVIELIHETIDNQLSNATQFK